jgi:hypothetical protein
MTLIQIPEIENIVQASCKDLIKQYAFVLKTLRKNEVILMSEKCGISITAAVSPIGEDQIDIVFFDPCQHEHKRHNYSHTFLLYINTRLEPWDVLDKCVEQEFRKNNTFNETIRIALKCFTAHTLKYRQDILNGDFTSWLPGETS